MKKEKTYAIGGSSPSTPLLFLLFPSAITSSNRFSLSTTFLSSKIFSNSSFANVSNLEINPACIDCNAPGAVFAIVGKHDVNEEGVMDERVEVSALV